MFKTSALFPANTGDKMFIGADVLVGMNPDGGGLRPFAAKVSKVDNTYGVAACDVSSDGTLVDGDGNAVASITMQNVAFDATVDGNGDPAALHNQKWMWLAHADKT